MERHRSILHALPLRARSYDVVSIDFETMGSRDKAIGANEIRRKSDRRVGIGCPTDCNIG